MRRALAVLSSSALLLVMSAAACSGSDASGDEAQVRAAFRTYKQAVLSGNGEAAAGVVTADTIEFYDRIRALALSADSEAVHGYSMINRLSIAAFRLLVSADTLRSLSGRQLFAYAVEHGIGIDQEGVTGLELDGVDVFGNTAKAKVVVRGDETPLEVEFNKERGAWKFDIEGLLGFADLALQEAADKVGIPEDELIYRALEAGSGRHVDASIWDPLQP
ncbi:MAG: hypothetical protein ABR518_03900 [Actinomycetota bacterium]